MSEKIFHSPKTLLFYETSKFLITVRIDPKNQVNKELIFFGKPELDEKFVFVDLISRSCTSSSDQ